VKYFISPSIAQEAAAQKSRRRGKLFNPSDCRGYCHTNTLLWIASVKLVKILKRHSVLHEHLSKTGFIISTQFHLSCNTAKFIGRNVKQIGVSGYIVPRPV
jgi:hypothetical protein